MNKVGLRGEEIEMDIGEEIEEKVIGVGIEEEVIEVDRLGEEKEKKVEIIKFK